MFAVVFVPNFALQSLLRHEPELRERPVALVEAAGANLAKALILECTRSAEAAGVCPGFTAPQAQARCRELVLKSRVPAAEPSATDILLQTACAFSPNIENTAPGLCTIDLRGLNFGGSEDDEVHERTNAGWQSHFTSTAARDHTAQQSFEFFRDTATRYPSPLKGEGAGVRGDALQRSVRGERHETHRSSPSIPFHEPGNSRCEEAPSEFSENDQSLLTSAATVQEFKAQNSIWGNSLPVQEGGKPDRTLLETWSGAIVTALAKAGLEAQVGIASTPNIALLAARAAKPVLFVECVNDFFHALPFAALEPAPQIFDIVKRWGIHTAGAFLALGKDAIAERLGAEALALFHRTSTQTIRPLNIAVPADTFEEQVDFEAHIETIEPLLFVLRRFVEQLATRIALTYRVVGELTLRLTLESGLPYERTFKVPAPTANVETLFRMLHTHLENLRTQAPVLSLYLAGSPVRAEGQQFGLFESALRDPNHFHETLARLTALLGADRVGTPVGEATHRPDAFQMKMPEFGEAQTRNPKLETRNGLGLCLRRFRSPVHAEIEMNNGQPAFISTLRVSARIKRARGPWRISGTWWDERRWSRQEWDVETEKGELYRLRNVNGDWVLEGVYD